MYYQEYSNVHNKRMSTVPRFVLRSGGDERRPARVLQLTSTTAVMCCRRFLRRLSRYTLTCRHDANDASAFSKLKVLLKRRVVCNSCSQ